MTATKHKDHNDHTGHISAVLYGALLGELRKAVAAYRTATYKESSVSHIHYLDGVADGIATALEIVTGDPSRSYRAEAMVDIQAEAEEGLAGVRMVRAILGRNRTPDLTDPVG